MQTIAVLDREKRTVRRRIRRVVTSRYTFSIEHIRKYRFAREHRIYQAITARGSKIIYRFVSSSSSVSTTRKNNNRHRRNRSAKARGYDALIRTSVRRHTRAPHERTRTVALSIFLFAPK